MTEKTIKGRLIELPDGCITFEEHPDGQWLMSNNLVWQPMNAGIDTYRKESVWKRFKWWLMGKIADWVK